MTRKQTIITSILSAILTGVFMYLVFYFPHEFVTCLFWVLSVAVCFMFMFLIIAFIWTKGDVLPNPYPPIYLPHIYLPNHPEKKENKL